MKAKIFSVLSFALLASVLLISLASATITFSSVPTLSQSGTSATITVSSNEIETVDFTIDDISSGGKTISFTLPTSSLLMNGVDSQDLTINYVIESGFDFKFGESFSTILTATDSASVDKTQKLSFDTSGFCEADNDGNLDVQIGDITVKGIDGKYVFSDDDNEWYPQEEIEIEVDIDNRGDEDVENIEVSWCLYDSDNDECVLEDDESDFDLDEGDDDTITITFTVDPNDLDSDVTDYEFHVRATGEITDGTYEGDDTCDSDSDNIDLIVGKDFVVLSNIEVPETLQCGSELSITADVWNIGEKDQQDIEVRVFNRDLKIDERINVGDIDTFEDDSISITLQIPSDAAEGSYPIDLMVYDEDGDLYESEDDEYSEFRNNIKIEGSCAAESSATISAVLESGGQAGKDLVIKATVTNTGSESESFTISATGYDSWAEAPNIEPAALVVLNAGQSQDVKLTMKVNKDVEGDQLFNIEANPAGDGETTSQMVSVTIEPRSGFGITGFAINSDNWHLWGIGVLNVILVLVIIIVAVRVARS